ncbi:MAG TPA: phospholipase D-like domain-containing protein [Blastocatellia bacterium]|nr:phospholipase D-like domain-containing protein [Blastocatellia bacterium]
MSKSKVSLIVQPGDSFFPIVEAIDAARQSINITIFRLDDPVIQKALHEAVARGVKVRALIAKFARGWEKENKKLLKDLAKSGIETKQPTVDSAKKRYHYKILTVDEARSLILTFNPTRENLHYTRDYGVVMYDPAVTCELARLFDADWFEKDFSVDNTLPLAISPYNSRSRLTDFLDSATRSIHISDAKVEDRKILDLLKLKAKGGVEVRVLGSKPSIAERGSQIEYRQITRFKMHAKCTVVDSERAFIASMNMRPVSLDARREVGILIDDPKAIAEIEHVFDSDWSQKRAAQQTMKTQIPGAVAKAAAAGAVGKASNFALLSRTDALSRFPLVDGENSIGRSSTNDIVIAHPSVSRAHACIHINGGAFVLEDLGSQNGTFLNGDAVEGKVPLHTGDIVGIAQSDEFRFLEV